MIGKEGNVIKAMYKGAQVSEHGALELILLIIQGELERAFKCKVHLKLNVENADDKQRQRIQNTHV